jgi:hypothetical protein
MYPQDPIQIPAAPPHREADNYFDFKNLKQYLLSKMRARKAIQDVWMGCPRGFQKIIIFGTTIRFYDPKIDAWYST